MANARALANSPRIILADEPTAALDSKRAGIVMDLLRKLAAEQDASIIAVTAVDNASKIAWLKSLGADEVINYREQDFARTGQQWDRILDMVATRGPAKIAPALSRGGIYRALGGNVGVLLTLVFGGLRFRFQKKSIGMLMVPSGRKLTERVAQMAVEGKMAPLLEAVLPLSSAPEALRRTGLGEVKGKLVIKL